MGIDKMIHSIACAVKHSFEAVFAPVVTPHMQSYFAASDEREAFLGNLDTLLKTPVKIPLTESDENGASY